MHVETGSRWEARELGLLVQVLGDRIPLMWRANMFPRLRSRSKLRMG